MTENHDHLALRVHDLSKIYQIYEKPTDRLRELLFHQKRHVDFVALKDINIALEKGKSLGIIGDNGAGKSTLLQLIAGTLSPTSGTIERQGTVLGLLELGIGFHIEFTGRQNIFFYGDVLGLPHSLIKGKYDEIVSFAELGDFIDRPLKTYSTGMRMRLAFALVSSLEPDILIVDEALAVGDSYFQKKCIDQILRIKNEGCTIIFCTHSIYQVGMFCEETLWLRNGRMERYGDTLPIIAAYEAYQLRKNEQIKDAQGDRQAHAPVRITAVEILNSLPIKRGDDLRIRIRTEASTDDMAYHVMVSIKFSSDFGVYATGTQLTGKPPIRGRQREIIVTYPRVALMGGIYWLHVRLFDDRGLIIYHDKVLLDPELEVLKDSNERGVCYLENIWEIS